MKPYRVVSIALLVIFAISALVPMIPVHAQSLFDGVVAYIGTDGNIYVLWENGSKQQVTFDAVVTDNHEYIPDKIWYDCLDLFTDKKHLFFTKRTNEFDTPATNVFYDLLTNTVIYSSPTEDGYCNFPGMDEKGLFYEINETEELSSGNTVERGYTQYISGARELNYEYTTKALYLPVVVYFYNMAIYQENPYEFVFYNFNTHEYLRISTPIEKFLDATRLSDNEIVFSSFNSDVIITVNLQSKQVEQWGFAVHNAIIIDTTKRGYYLVAGDHGEGTPKSLYKVDLNRQSSEVVYTPSVPVLIWAKTSPVTGAIYILEESPDYWAFYSLIMIPNQGSPIKITSSADSNYQWSNDSKKVYYIELTQLSPDDNMLNRELMVYDVATSSRTKIIDIIPSGGYGEEVQQPISWILNDSPIPDPESSVAPSDTAPDSTTQTNPQNQPSIFEPFINSNYTPILVIGGIGTIVLLGLGAGAVWWTTRPKNKPNAPVMQRGQVPPSPVSPQIQNAIRLAKEKRFKESFEILRELVKSEGNNPEIWYYLGYDLVNMGDFVNAERCFSRAKQYGHPKADNALNWIKNNRQP